MASPPPVVPPPDDEGEPVSQVSAAPQQRHEELWCRYPVQRVTRDLHTRLCAQRAEIVRALLDDPPPGEEALTGSARVFLIHVKGHLDQEIAMVESLLWSQ